MSSEDSGPKLLRFESFAADLRTAELRKGGRLVKLQPQPFKLLVLLASRPGELVTREEIQKELWSDDTFVDFEHGINYCIKEIRTALGDDADNSRFVQTVPRRGYRFITAVKAETPELMAEAGLGEVSKSPAAANHSSSKKRSLLVASTAIVIAVVIGTYLLVRPGRNSGRVPIEGRFTQLTSHRGLEVFPSLSPDGDFVAYAALWTGSWDMAGNWDIYIQRVKGGDAINLTADSGFSDTQPSFSQDGEWIAFRSERDGGGIFIMGATGESVRRLTDFGYNPIWYPDGRSILCETAGTTTPSAVTAGTVEEIWKVDVSTGKKRVISKGSGKTTQPISPGASDCLLGFKPGPTGYLDDARRRR